MSFSDVAGRIAGFLDGYKTHLANVGTFAITVWFWHKGVIPGAEAFALMAFTGLSSLFRLFSKRPGPLAP